jgi:predicted nucleotidyltransferase
MSMNEQDRISIQRTLESLESAENSIVLLAVESGSRAWGFESTDSDYDVRFIYVRPPEWYLSIDLETQRDVIERPLENEIDLSGWDVRKALQLFQKSNPPLLEWLQCPIIYRERFLFAARLRELLPEFYSPRACFFHYLHMARGNIREYLQGEIVWRKKYFYVLRPLLAMRWIDQELGPVPIEFQKLIDATVHDASVRAALEQLIAAKRAGAELDRGPRIPVISDFITSELTRLENTASDRTDPAPQVERLNEVFRSTLKEVWQSQHGVECENRALNIY